MAGRHSEKRLRSRNAVVLCDFDGTILGIDTCVFLLETFGTEDWKALDQQYARGEITIEECMQHQMSTLQGSPQDMLRELEKVTVVRPNFETLIAYCAKNSVPLIIVSAGLDFVIRHFVERNGWRDHVQVKAAKTTVRDDGITLTFPALRDDTSHDFKEDLVKHHKQHARSVIYVGDGLSDYHAVRAADLAFVVTDSRLAERCQRTCIPHREISDFQDVIDALKCLRAFQEGDICEVPTIRET